MPPILRTALNRVFSSNRKSHSISNPSLSNEKRLSILISDQEWRNIKKAVRKRINCYQTGISRIERQRRKKFAKKIIFSLGKIEKKKRHAPLPSRILSIRKKKSLLLSSFYPNRDKEWKTITKRSRKEIEINLSGFSLLDNQINTIKSLQEIAMAESKYLGFKINFLDTYCSDISPYLILGLMRQDIPPIVLGGQITPAITGMVDAVGLADFLSIGHIQRKQEEPTFHAFRVRYRRAPGTSTSQNTATEPSQREGLTDDLIDTVDHWLEGMVQKKLNKDGKGYLSSIVGEVLNNAERHSDLINKDGDWAIAAFLTAVKEKKDSNKVKFFCSLSMVSLGATIHESISKCEDDNILNSMNGYIMKHSRDKKISRECLATVYALQDGVSRLKQDDLGEQSRGGVGMMDMVQFVGALGKLGIHDAPPSITLLSGSTCLNIRQPHFDLTLDQAQKNFHRQIWFNETNNIAEAPDADYVKSLPVHFPGTAVAIRFYISPNSDSLSHEEGGV
ncbi:hypothetical protein J4P41_01915 [Gluconobacter sp. NFX36]|uniref:hypothetical protein n=1 Tax=Gluconobacter sp. NFX36 TaxID=2819535 RepID=UPI003CFA00CD